MPLKNSLEYLCLIKKNSIFYEDQHMCSIINSLCTEYDIDFIEIFTNKIFPRIISDNKETLLVWDMNYWKMYEQFLRNICLLENTSISSAINDILSDTISIFGYFLSLSLKKESLEIYFAQKYHIWKSNINTAISNPYFSEYLEIGKIYCIIHELTHHRLNIDKKFKKESFDLINKAISDSVHSLNINDNKNFIESNFFTNKNTLINSFNSCKESNLKKEELICNLTASNDCLKIFSKKLSYTKNENICILINAIQLIDYFNCMLIQLKNIWHNYSINKYNNDSIKKISSDLHVNRDLKENIFFKNNFFFLKENNFNHNIKVGIDSTFRSLEKKIYKHLLPNKKLVLNIERSLLDIKNYNYDKYHYLQWNDI